MVLLCVPFSIRCNLFRGPSWVDLLSPVVGLVVFSVRAACFQRLFMRRDGVISHLMKTHERVFVLVFRRYGENLLALVLLFAVFDGASIVATVGHDSRSVKTSLGVVKVRDNLP